MRSLRQNLSHFKHGVLLKQWEECKRMLRWGPRAYWNIDAWKREMEEAAMALPKVEIGKAESGNEYSSHASQASGLRSQVLDFSPPLSVWFLTGKRFWYQTAFCAWSLQYHSRHVIQPVILDDGTLESEDVVNLKRIFPELALHSKETCDVAFNEFFPSDRYPNLHFWRNKQILFRKITDIHAGSRCRRLFLDSDMLVYRTPKELDDWHESHTGENIVQKDCWESYGYSRGLTEKLCGRKLPEAVNIGIFSLDGSMIDWDQVEFWTGKMMEEEGFKYNITQCTVAMILSASPLKILDAEDYKVWPSKPKRPMKPRVLEHYVADSKPWYFGSAWKKAIQSAGNERHPLA